MQRTRTHTLALAALALVALGALAGCSTMPVVGAGEPETESRELERFDALDLGISADAIVVFDGGSSVEITAAPEHLAHITTEVVDGELRIEADRVFLDAHIDLVVHASTLDALGVSGDGSLRADGIDQTNLAVHSTGSGALTLRGQVDHLEVVSNGSGDIDLDGLSGEEVVLQQSGSGTTTLVALGSVHAKTDGSGLVELRGNARLVDVRASGSGTWSGSALAADVVRIDSSGSSHVEVAVSDTLEVDSSGSGSVRYVGQPNVVDVTIDGSGTVAPSG